jgi:hypothetical protein
MSTNTDNGLWLDPSKDWLRRWAMTRSGAPFNFLPHPILMLTRPNEPLSPERAITLQSDFTSLLPLTLVTKAIEKVYSPVYFGSILVMIFEPNDAMRNLVRVQGGRAANIYNQGEFTPHMILAPSFANSVTNRTFIGSMQTYTHGAEVVFDEVGYSANCRREMMYESHVESFHDVISRY